jgi:hypothetical protein
MAPPVRGLLDLSIQSPRALLTFQRRNPDDSEDQHRNSER